MIRSVLINKILRSVGLVCLAMSLLLMPAGVRSVRAEDGEKALMSVDPTLVAGEPSNVEGPAVAPVVEAAAADEAVRPGSAGTEVQPGVIVLNTRGYNYGPLPSELDPAALGQEAKTR